MSIGMPADFPVDRANIQTGRTADAVQHFPELFICQDAAAAVVQDDQMKFIRTVSLVRIPGPADIAGVGPHILGGCSAAQQS